VASAQESINRDIVAWLSPLYFRATQNACIAKYQNGTLQWLFEDSLFRDWLEGNKKFLWCPGIRKLPFLNATFVSDYADILLAGAGKTILAY
jgi:hypothetical protein